MVKKLCDVLCFENPFKIIKKMDKTLLFFTIFLLIFGLIMVLSSSNVTSYMKYDDPFASFFTKQAVFIIGGLLISFVIIGFNMNSLRKISWIIIFAIIFLLLVCLIQTSTINNTKSWLIFKGITIQPSEFFKVCSIIWLSNFYNKNYKNPPTSYFTCGCLVGFGVLLIALQPDWGTAGIIFIILFSMLLNFDNFRKWFSKYFMIFVGVLVFIIIVFIFSPTAQNRFSMQINRLTSWLSPCSSENYYKDGNQVCNGLIAINTGGVFGKGLGNSIQKYMYLPEAYSDFIFPIIVEELGLVGGLVALFSLFMVLYRIYRIGMASKNFSNRLVCFGVFVYIFIHILVNLCGVTASFILTGVPLPFFSYGGSFMVSLLISIAFVQRVSIENKKESMNIKN